MLYIAIHGHGIYFTPSSVVTCLLDFHSQVLLACVAKSFFICSFLAVIGSLEYPLQNLQIEGSVRADGDNSSGSIQKKDSLISVPYIGPGGGSGGSILLFLHTLSLGESAILSSTGGHGSMNGGGGGGGGRIHFHWSDISTGDVYSPIALVNGSILAGLVQMLLLLPLNSCNFWNNLSSKILN